MKKMSLIALVGLVFYLSTSLIPVYAAPAAAVRPTISVSPSVIALEKNAKLVIMGSGYRPGQEVLILFHDALGVLTALPDAAVANDRGSWAAVWDMADYVGRKIVTDGVYAIMSADAKYNVIATTTAGFVDVSKDLKDWPDWATAAGIKKPEAKQTEGKQKEGKKKKE